MAILTTLITYSLVQAGIQVATKPLIDRLTKRGRQNELLAQMEAKHKLDLEIARCNKEIDRENSLNLQAESHRYRLLQVEKQYEQQIEFWNMQQVNASMFPLVTPLTDPGLRFDVGPENPVPINLFLTKAPPKSSYARLMQSEIENNLTEFIQNDYRSTETHPYINRIGDWKEGFQSPAHLQTLWTYLQGRPSVVLNPVQTDQKIRLDVSFWNLAQDGYSPPTQTIFDFAYPTEMGRVIREETLSWLKKGLPHSSDDFRRNVALLEREEKLSQNGVEREALDKLLVQYVPAVELFDVVSRRVSDDFSFQLNCAGGMFIDVYHLIERGVAPYLPKAIESYNRRVDAKRKMPRLATDSYRKALTCLTCCNYFQDKMPSIYLEAAKTFETEQDFAVQLVCDGVGLWANRKLELNQSVDLPTNLEECVRLIRDSADERDAEFIQRIGATLKTLGVDDAFNKIPQVALPSTRDFWASEYETEYIEIAETKLEIVRDVTQERAKLAKQAQYFVFTIWNPSVIIGTFADADFWPAIYGDTDKNRFLIFYCGQNFSSKGKGKQFFLNLNNNEFGELTMAESRRYEDGLGKRAEELGRRAGRILDQLSGKRAHSRSSANDRQSSSGLGIQQVIAFFQAKMRNGEIAVELKEGLELDTVLDWVGSLPQINGNQIYIVKGLLEQGQKNIICVFFAQDGKLHLNDDDTMKCFVCKKLDRDFADVFEGSDVYVIPIE